tara:strand:+ start:4270 stop:4602 length:333 start_codon:yes stop_codon:yes gene_type:complete
MSNPAFAVTDHRGMNIGQSMGQMKGETPGKHLLARSEELVNPVVRNVILARLMSSDAHGLLAKFAFDDGQILGKKCILSVAGNTSSLRFGDLEYRCRNSYLYKFDHSSLN